MDIWPPRERRKRSFAHMSQSSTLSPSPANFGDPTSNLFNPQHYLPASNNNSQSSRAGSFFERRRTSHPHNPPLHRASDGMGERSQSRSRPRLDNQVSIIDLTDDAEDQLMFAPARNHSHRPPQLGRSDAVGFADFIDLTEDGEPDLIITGVQERRRPEPPARQNARSPSLFVPLEPALHHRHSPAFSGRALGNLGNHANFIGHLGEMGQILGVAHDIMDHVLLFHQGMGGQPMPNHMDYQANAFVQRKAEHVPPPKPRPGFTRSPKEEDMIICPSCEEEMIHKKDEEEPPIKKGGKPPTKKDREEHPFWVVKDCGHVYCNHCYQNRQTANKGSSTVSFPEIERSSSNGKGRVTKILACAVDGCKSDVKSKDKWVGVFL